MAKLSVFLQASGREYIAFVRASFPLDRTDSHHSNISPHLTPKQTYLHHPPGPATNFLPLYCFPCILLVPSEKKFLHHCACIIPISIVPQYTRQIFECPFYFVLDLDPAAVHLPSQTQDMEPETPDDIPPFAAYSSHSMLSGHGEDEHPPPLAHPPSLCPLKAEPYSPSMGPHPQICQTAEPLTAADLQNQLQHAQQYLFSQGMPLPQGPWASPADPSAGSGPVDSYSLAGAVMAPGQLGQSQTSPRSWSNDPDAFQSIVWGYPESLQEQEQQPQQHDGLQSLGVASDGMFVAPRSRPCRRWRMQVNTRRLTTTTTTTTTTPAGLTSWTTRTTPGTAVVTSFRRATTMASRWTQPKAFFCPMGRAPRLEAAGQEDGLSSTGYSEFGEDLGVGLLLPLVPLQNSGDQGNDIRSGTASTSKSGEEPYAQLIWRAFMSTPSGAMKLQELYQWFRNNTDKAKDESRGWQNSIRHNLSMNEVCFIFKAPILSWQ